MYSPIVHYFSCRERPALSHTSRSSASALRPGANRRQSTNNIALITARAPDVGESATRAARLRYLAANRGPCADGQLHKRLLLIGPTADVIRHTGYWISEIAYCVESASCHTRQLQSCPLLLLHTLASGLVLSPHNRCDQSSCPVSSASAD